MGAKEQLGKCSFLDNLVSGRNGTIKGETKCEEDELIFNKPSNPPGEEDVMLIKLHFGCESTNMFSSPQLSRLIESSVMPGEGEVFSSLFHSFSPALIDS